MSVHSQRSFDPEVDYADVAEDGVHGDLTENSYDPEALSGGNRSSSFSERSFDPECSMLDDENGSYDASEASFDPDADRRSSMRSEKSFDPERAGGEQDLTGFEVGSHTVPKTISAAIAERAITSIRNVASQELERLRSEVDTLRTALDASERRSRRHDHMYDPMMMKE